MATWSIHAEWSSARGRQRSAKRIEWMARGAVGVRSDAAERGSQYPARARSTSNDKHMAQRRSSCMAIARLDDNLYCRRRGVFSVPWSKSNESGARLKRELSRAALAMIRRTRDMTRGWSRSHLRERNLSGAPEETRELKSRMAERSQSRRLLLAEPRGPQRRSGRAVLRSDGGRGLL